VKLIVGFPPGGVPDIVARGLAQELATGLGQPVLVENRAGAAGTMGLDAAARAPADGYTLVLGTTGTLASAPALYPGLGYDPVRSFTPVSLIARAPFVVVTDASLPVSSLDGLITLARAKPGRLNFGSVGNGSPPHIAGEMFNVRADVKLTHVPYKGLPTAVTDLLSGRIEVMFNQLAPFLPHIQSGKLRALAVAGPQRLPQLPDVPTAAEAGLSGYEVSIWFGLLTPAGTPRDIVARLNTEVVKALASPRLQVSLGAQGFDVRASSPEQFASLIGTERERWTAAIKAAGVRLDP
jgi:tripartite-type tricarboxylate transporter receptor subunit TctC